MAAPGDLFALLPDPTVAAGRVRRRRIRCRNPLCRRWVYVDRAVYGYGEDCAETRGLVVHRWKLTDHGQEGPNLFTHPQPWRSPVSGIRRFTVSPDGGSIAAEGVRFSDGTVVVKQAEVDKPDIYKAGTVVAGKVTDGEVPNKLISKDYGDREITLTWLDTAPAAGNVPAAMQPAGLLAEQADAEAAAAEDADK